MTAPRQSRSLDALLDRMCAVTADDLPSEVADHARLLIADSVICGLAGAGFSRTGMQRSILVTAGGAPEAEVVGAGTRIPALHAAFINADAMNLLDSDDTFLNGAHFGSLIVAAALAEAQRTGADWDDLVLAVVRGYDLTARLHLGVTTDPRYLPTGLMAPGAALAAASVSGADRRTMARAVAIAMKTAVGPAPRAWTLAELSSIKYAPYGSLAMGAVLAARLAAEGYVADHRLLAAEPGFVHAQGGSAIDPHRLYGAPGEPWWIRFAALKRYPVFRIGHPALDALAEIVEDTDLAPDEIESVTVWLDPRALTLPFHDTVPERLADDHLAPIRAPMHLRRALALVAARIPPGPSWVSGGALGDPGIDALRRRITVADEPACPPEALAARADPLTGRVLDVFARVEVRARGRRFTAERDRADGDPWHPDTRPDWDWLAAKELAYLGRTDVVRAVRDTARHAPIGSLLR